MEKHIKVEDTILLLDHYGQDSQSLHTSFARAGFSLPVIVIQESGFLPDGQLGEILGGVRRPECAPAQFSLPPMAREVVSNRASK